ncbi:hypothetical protein OPQ81_012016 [Rhizoctonia solani]|nr:hypothetical protein OPQ81_012016 [Rhizoctonia solani]
MQVALRDAVQKWELMSTRLADTLTDYLDACATLESSATEIHPDNNIIVPKLNLALETLYAHLTQQVLQSRSLVARTRNKLAITIYRIPDEVLSNIFSLLIYSTNREQALLPESSVWQIYRRLYSLMSVCSDWRRLCLSRGMYWSLIPMRRYKSDSSEWDHINRILERSQGSNLYLGGILGSDPDSALALQNTLVRHGPRFRSLNIAGKNCDMLRGAAKSLLDQKHLTDFSICYLTEEATEYLFPLESPEYASFKRHARTLKSLRLCGLDLDWGNIRLDSLTELKIQNLKPQRRYKIKDLLMAAASAPHLRHLHLSRVSHTQEVISIPPSEEPSVPPIMLPSLQTIYLENIHKDLVVALLRLIAPGSYKTELHFTRASNFYAGDAFNHNWARGLNIDTLMITDWLIDGHHLQRFLKTMPTITTLYIANRILEEETFRALARPIKSSPAGSDSGFPKLRALYINNSVLCISKESKLASFKEVITSHEIQELGIDGVMELPRGSNPESTGRFRFNLPDDDQHTAPIKEWLTNNVRKFIIPKTPEDMPYFDFQTCFWRLWHRG